MELRPGYKQTEVGIIPEDWDAKSLGELGEALIGLTYKPADVREHGTLVLRSSNIRNDTLVFDDNVFVDRDIPERIKVRAGDVLICVRNGSRDLIGKSVLLDERTVGMTFGAFMAIYRSRMGQLASFLFQSEILKRQVHEHLGATINQITNKSLNSFQVPVARSSAEQRAIAVALTDVDALLEALTRLIEKKRDLKQAAMQQLLTARTRLPGFHGEWVVKRLGEVAPLQRGFDLPSSQLRAGPFPVVYSNGVLNFHAFFQADGPGVVTGRSGTIGKVTFVEGPYWPHNTALWVTNFKNNDPRFVFYLYTQIGFVRFATGSGVPTLNRNDAHAFEAAIPATKAEQSAIATVLSDMDAELAALEARRDKTRALKQAMMQELLTGRTRLVVPAVTESRKDAERTAGRQANIHFKRSILAAEIIDRLHDEPTFGHVKFEKMVFLVEHLCEVDTGSTYHRDAAGPYDNRAIRSIDSQLRKQKWFDAQKIDGRYRYEPMTNHGKHREYFDRYYGTIGTTFDTVIETFRGFTTERCEIVATLFGAWRDLLQQNDSVSDDAIVKEVLNNWHKSKKRIPEERWRKALSWMRDHGFVPRRGNGA